MKMWTAWSFLRSLFLYSLASPISSVNQDKRPDGKYSPDSALPHFFRNIVDREPHLNLLRALQTFGLIGSDVRYDDVFAGKMASPWMNGAELSLHRKLPAFPRMTRARLDRMPLAFGKRGNDDGYGDLAAQQHPFSRVSRGRMSRMPLTFGKRQSDVAEENDKDVRLKLTPGNQQGSSSQRARSWHKRGLLRLRHLNGNQVHMGSKGYGPRLEPDSRQNDRMNAMPPWRGSRLFHGLPTFSPDANFLTFPVHAKPHNLHSSDPLSPGLPARHHDAYSHNRQRGQLRGTLPRALGKRLSFDLQRLHALTGQRQVYTTNWNGNSNENSINNDGDDDEDDDDGGDDDDDNNIRMKNQIIDDDRIPVRGDPLNPRRRRSSLSRMPLTFGRKRSTARSNGHFLRLHLSGKSRGYITRLRKCVILKLMASLKNPSTGYGPSAPTSKWSDPKGSSDAIENYAEQIGCEWARDERGAKREDGSRSEVNAQPLDSIPTRIQGDISVAERSSINRMPITFGKRSDRVLRPWVVRTSGNSRKYLFPKRKNQSIPAVDDKGYQAQSVFAEEGGDRLKNEEISIVPNSHDSRRDNALRQWYSANEKAGQDSNSSLDITQENKGNSVTLRCQETP